jgi:hypothetical protein
MSVSRGMVADALSARETSHIAEIRGDIELPGG